METRDEQQEPVPLKQKFSSRQFLITLVGMGLVYHATLQGSDVGPLAGVVTVAIVGVAGVNFRERMNIK